MTGGAGAAIASGGFTWLPWAEDPDFAHAFTLPSGRACEMRYIAELPENDESEDPIASPEVWDAFVTQSRTLPVDHSRVEQWAATIRNDPTGAIQAITVDGQFQDPPPGDIRTEDDLYAAAHYVAGGESLSNLAESLGILPYWEANVQIQCEADAS